MRAGIRVRITAVATVAVVAVLLLTALGLVAYQRRVLTEDVDDSLLLRNHALAKEQRSLVAPGGESDPVRMLTGQGDEDAVAQVVDASGQVVAATSNFESQPPLPAPPGDGGASWNATHLPSDDARYRLLSRRDGDLIVHTATPLDDVDDSVATLRRGMAYAIPSVAVVLALLVWWLVGRTLRPMEAMRSEVADISGSSLHRRVPVPGVDDEVARMATTMNAMLDRIEEAAERRRRFVADASHELRSPLARMRAEIEVDLAHPETADLAATHQSVLEEAAHLQQLVDDLLHLARTDSGAGGGSRVPVDLDDLVLREVDRMRAVGGVRVDAGGVSAAQVTGDPDQLARAIRNLAENAARHASTTVTFTVRESDGVAEMAVADDGPGIPEEDRERVFERFSRLDSARSAGDGGTGLGLAITRDVVEGHGGTVRVDPDHSPGARLVITLPSPPVWTETTS